MNRRKTNQKNVATAVERFGVSIYSVEFLLPPLLNPGDTIGVFTPSSPSYRDNPELFENGIRNLEKLGFKVQLGSLTVARSSQGYSSRRV